MFTFKSLVAAIFGTPSMRGDGSCRAQGWFGEGLVPGQEKLESEDPPQTRAEALPQFILAHSDDEYRRRREALERRFKEEPMGFGAEVAGLNLQAEELSGRWDNSAVQRELNRRAAVQLREQARQLQEQSLDRQRELKRELADLEKFVRGWEGVRVAHEGQILMQTPGDEGVHSGPTHNGLAWRKERRLVRLNGRAFVVELIYTQLGRLIGRKAGGVDYMGRETQVDAWVPTGDGWGPPETVFITDSLSQFKDEELELLR